MSIFSIVLVGMIIIFSQFPIVFAGLPCDSDYDGDSYTPCEGDCDDSNPNKYPGHGCEIPIQEIKSVISDVNDLADDGTINSGQANALLSKLQNAIDKIDSNQINAAIGSLKAFINQITAFINSGKISSSVGNSLIADVKNIIDTLRMG
ncbi:MAG: FIMAH domain-containing protein [Nitrosopumilaceae archaeon]